ncbi:hypothetical protein WJX72_010444 [[Myrmecia] bisecta]|uniref:Uncharacterized protein n=1 Tax=[Myrmecia] bisecta TaxID=41462 RepID=A0AAW1PFC6_9CHLO
MMSSAQETTPAQVFPLMVPADASLGAYDGYLSLSAGALNSKLWMRLSSLPSRPGAPLSESCRLEMGEPLALLLEGYEGLVLARLKECTTVAAFFLELRTLLENILQTRPSCEVPPPSFYSGLVQELDEVGWDHLVWLQEDLAALRLRLSDRAGRDHELRVDLPAGYPATPPSVQADLPREVTLHWPPGSSLTSVVHQYSEAADSCCDLWECLEDFDRECSVMEPEQPSRSALFRRIAVGGHSSLVVTLDPDNPRSIPECRFMGSEAAVAPLREKLRSNRHLWDDERLTRVNLERVLDLRLPSQTEAALDDISANCCICYGYRLLAHPDQDPTLGETPDINCENPQCGRPFHRACLVEWLQSNNETRRSFDTLFGQCLYCTNPITVKALRAAF